MEVQKQVGLNVLGLNLGSAPLWLCTWAACLTLLDISNHRASQRKLRLKKGLPVGAANQAEEIARAKALKWEGLVSVEMLRTPESGGPQLFVGLRTAQSTG